MSKKALFTDLDGTLLNDRKEITEGNRRAIERMLEAGHDVIITTGRPLPSAVLQAEKLGLTAPGCRMIAFNGCTLYDTFEKRILWHNALSLSHTFRLFDEANRRGIHVQTYSETGCLVEPRCDTEIVRRYCGTILLPFEVIPDIRELKRPPEKVMLISYDRPDLLAEVRQWLRDFDGGALDCNSSYPEYLEIMNRGVTKGAALKKMTELLGIPLSDTVAAGDAENDLAMIKAAGTGVAMQNASQAVKDAADCVTERDNNHDGVAELIERFFFS